MDRILVIAAGWRFRALVRAQLVEEGFEVSAWPGPEPALAYLLRGGEPPQMVVLDTEDLEIQGQMVSALWQLAGRVPLLLCSGASSQAGLDGVSLPPAEVLRRPFRVRDVVGRVHRALSHP